MHGHALVLLAALLLTPYAFVNFGFGLAMALIQLFIWFQGERRRGPLLLRLGRRQGTERLVELGAAAVAIGALLEMAAAALDTPVTVWGLRMGVALAVAGLATVASALRPVELREPGIFVRGQLIPWRQMVGYAWSADTDDAAVVEISYGTVIGGPRRTRFAVPDESRTEVERLFRQRISPDNLLATLP